MRSVFLVGFDGLQPAQVTPELMPNLAEFAAEDVTTVTITPYSDDPAAETKRWEPLIQRLAEL